MTIAQSILVYFISPIISIMIILIFAQVILSWLVGFGIVNLRHPMMASIYHGISRFVNPILSPIQRIIPPMGGLDLSPIVAFFGLQWLNWFVMAKLYPALG